MPDNLLNPKADRTPNWDKWRLIPKLTPSQCAALWANIDPDKIRYVGGEGWKESQEFKDRLHLVQANLYGALKSKNGKVDLCLFATWVRDLREGWDAPDELLAMAHQRPQDVNWDYWGALDLWPLDTACKLISGYDPHEPTRREDIENRDANRPKWVNVYHQAHSSKKAGNLSITDGEEVKPAEFLTWAREKAYPVQRELEAAVSRFHPKFEDRQEAAWEGFDPDSDTYPPELDIALQAWRAATKQRDLSKTVKKQIREWLEVHYPKEVSKEAKERIAVVCNWERAGGKPRRE